MCCYLPEIIIINILQRLPAKTLLRCTSVCKSWYSLITSAQFIYSHLNFTAAGEQHARVVLLRRCARNSERYDLYSDDDSFTRLCRLEFPFRSINSCFTLVGSCNGLLCLSDDRVYFTHTIIVWNPSVKRSVLLPKPRLIYNSFGTFIQCLGFGFDSVTCDHKVVRITYVDCNGDYPLVELYRLSTGVWEDMSYLKFGCVIYNRSRQVFTNGAVHWVASFTQGFDLITLFDMQCEVFREMMLPESLAKKDPMRSKDLVVFRDSLGLVLWNAGDSGFCVWVMDEYGVANSWIKHLRINIHELGGGFVRPLWVRRCGGVVSVWQDGQLICCSPDGKDFEGLGVKGSRSEGYRRTVHVDFFVESLVLLNRGACLFDGNVSTASYIDDGGDSTGSAGSDGEPRAADGEYKHGYGS